AGFRNITLYDLPQMNILQSYFLSKSLPNAKISLYSDPNTNLESSEIRILPYWHLDQVPSKSFGICVNQDSLPEIPQQIATHYLKEIKRTTRDFFYSINQEAKAPNYKAGIQESVPRLIDMVGGFERKMRTPFWCRQGYVQEIYNMV
ncbi:MAG: putative sugar O-methyltransferase, partial [Patescibacteria group bacterium]|nr:putative sugar O-methyltransferase [Patescibacteria group bacterium]